MGRPILIALLTTYALAAQPKPGDSAIEGHVLSLGGAPIKKATVTLTGEPTGGYQVRLTADTDGDGKFQFLSLPSGTYRLSASRAGFQEHAARRAFRVGASDHVTDAEIRLPQQGVLSGRVLDEDGDPSPNAVVLIMKQSYRNGPKHWEAKDLTASTNENGEYRIPYIAPGRYIVRAQSRRPASDNRYYLDDSHAKALDFYVPTYYPSSADEQSAQPIDAGFGADIRGIDIRLVKIVQPAAPLYHVRGKVTGLTPNLEGYVIVSLFSTEASGSTATVARPPDYAFDAAVRPGQYTIRVNAPSATAYGSGSISVTGDISGVEVAMSPAPEIAGRITMAESGAQVSLKSINIDLRSRYSGTGAMSDSAGKFSISKLEPGTYSIYSLGPIPDGCYIREVRFHGQEVSWDGFDISASGQLDVVLSTAAGQIAGTVLDANGDPFPISTVTLIPADGKSRPAKQAVDDNGAFRFTNVRPGDYKLFAWEEVDDDLWPDPEFRKKYEDRAVAVTVGPRETQTVQLRVIPFEAMN